MSPLAGQGTATLVSSHLFRPRRSGALVKLLAPALFAAALAPHSASAAWLHGRLAIDSLRPATSGAEVSGWASDGERVSPTGSDPVVAPDGAGGVYLAWQVYQGGIATQHLTAAGEPAPGWPEGGNLNPTGCVDPVIAPDDRGGAFMAAANGWDVGVWRLAPGGAMASASLSGGASDARSALAAGSRGLPAAVAKIEPTILPTVISDGAGGAFVTWEQGGLLSVYCPVLHYSADGAVARFAPANVWGCQHAPVICVDGACGAIQAWLDYGNSNIRVLARRIDGTGTQVAGWPADGLTVCAAPGTRDALGITPDGAGGAIIVWEDHRSGAFQQLYAQRITATGSIAAGWPAGGLAVCTYPTIAGIVRDSRYRSQAYSSIVGDGAGGGFIAWQDARADDGDIYLQHLLPDGTMPPGWPQNGLAVCAAPGIQQAPALAADGAGGVLVAWEGARAGPDHDIYVQRVTASGAVLAGWAPGGTPSCTARGDQVLPRAATDGAGGAILAWQDPRCGSTGIFATHVAADGGLPAAPGVGDVTVAVIGSAADSGLVRVDWRVTSGAGCVAIATVFCRQVDTPWMAVGVVVPDADGHVTYADLGAIAGCRYGYGLGIQNSCTAGIVGEKWVDVPAGSGFFQPSVANRSAKLSGARVVLSWQVAGGEGLPATILRGDSCSGWTSLGSVAADDSGRVALLDPGPFFAGLHVWYRLAVGVCGTTRDLDTVRVDVPEGGTFIPTQVRLDAATPDSTSTGLRLSWVEVAGPPGWARLYREDSTGHWSLRATGAPGASALNRRWTFLDTGLNPEGVYGYRLGLWSCGVESFSDPVHIRVPQAPPTRAVLSLRSVRPNPASHSLAVAITLVDHWPATLALLDPAGREVLRREIATPGPGDYTIDLAGLSTLRPGLYFVLLSQGIRSQSRRLAVVR